MISDFPDLATLSAGDKILLAAELFDQAALDSEAVQVDNSLLRVIEERLDHIEKNPGTGLSWDQVKGSLSAND